MVVRSRLRARSKWALKKVLFVFACLFAFGFCPAQADEGKVYKYTYELSESGRHLCDVEDLSLSSPGVRVVGFLVGWTEQVGCILSMRITDIFPSGQRSPVAVLGKRADAGGNENGVWHLYGTLRLSNGEMWTVRPFFLQSSIKEEFKEEPEMGVVDFSLDFNRVAVAGKSREPERAAREK